MKRIALLVLSSLTVLACVTTPASPPQDANDVVALWASSLEGKNLDALMSTYWPDAVLVNLTPDENGEQQTMTGSDEIREMQKGVTENPDIQAVVRLDSARREMVGDKAVYTIEVDAAGLAITDTLKLEQRGGEWRIVYQTLEF